MGPRFGVLLMLIMSFVFEAKRPAEENERRFKGAMHSGIATGISYLAITFAYKYQLMFAENLPLFVFCILQTLIGIVQPTLYIMSKENLKSYAWNLLATKVVQPIRQFVCRQSNQVGPLELPM